MFAVISDRTRQFTVRAGDQVLLDLGQEARPGESLTFSEVLLVGDEGTVTLGRPFVEGASVLAEVLGRAQGEKVVSMRFHRRKNMRRKTGHRQGYLSVRIQEIRT